MTDPVRDALDEYAAWRLKFYRTTKLARLLTKDVLMFALRGVSTSDEFVEHAFAAFESSSEEGVMGKTWQRVLKDLSQPAVVDAGDVLAEREGSLWVVEVKSQTNTLNSSSQAQTVRTLKNRVEYHRTFQPTRPQPVRAMIGVMRGREVDREITFSSSVRGRRTET